MKKAAKAAANSGAPPTEEPEEEGCIIDNLLKEIRSGTTLRPAQKRQTQRAPQLSGKDLEQLKKIAASVVDDSAHQLAEGVGPGVSSVDVQSAATSEAAIEKPHPPAEKPHPLAEKPHPPAEKPHPPTEGSVPAVNGNEPTLQDKAKTVVVNGNEPSPEVSEKVNDKPPLEGVAMETVVVNGNDPSQKAAPNEPTVAKETTKHQPSSDVPPDPPVVNGNDAPLEVAPPTNKPEGSEGATRMEGTEEREREREGEELERSLSPLERMLRSSCSPERDASSGGQVSHSGDENEGGGEMGRLWEGMGGYGRG